MAAQDEREPGDIDLGEGVFDPMVQDIPEQDIGMQEQEPSPTEPRARNGRGSGCGV